MKKKLLIVILVLLMLITSFFVLTKKPKIKYKKLKELNYNVTYKQAFPDENLRRSVLLCIMRNKCENVINYDRLSCPDTSNFATSLSFGSVITEDEIKTKEAEQLNKVALDKIKQIIPNICSKTTTNLQGIEYLKNLSNIWMKNLSQENIDFSYNKELTSITFVSSNFKNIDTSQNIKLNNINFWFLSKEERSFDFSHLSNLNNINIVGSSLKNIDLPDGIETADLSQNKIENITLPISVRSISLSSNNITNINLPEGIEEVYLAGNNIENITIPTSIKNLSLDENKISHIDLPEGIKYVSLNKNNLTSITLPSGMKIAHLKENKIENVTLRGPVENLILENNNISHIDLLEGIKILDLSDNKIEEITLPSTLETLDMHDNKISNIDLPDGIETANLSFNKISNIDVSNNPNLIVLDLNYNRLEDIDVRNNTKLRVIKFYLKNSKDTIDFSNNPNLEEVEIDAKEGAKIKSLDFSNNPDLHILKLYNLGLTNLNIDSNINLDYIDLSNNNLESIDLTNKTKIRYVYLSNNTSNLKLPVLTHNHKFRVDEHRKLKIKKNSLVTIPTMIYNNKEFFIQDNPNYEKVGDKYVFKNIGTFNVKEPFIEKVDGYWSKDGDVYYEFEVEAGEEDSFNPVFNQGNYTPIINEEIPVNSLKEMITNLPANIKNFEVLSSNTFTEKGDKTIKVRITFSDDTFKEVDIPIKVYEKEDILPTVTVSPETLEVIDKKPVNITISRTYAKEDNIDNTNFIKTVRDNLVSYEYLNKANGLTYNSSGIAGVIDYLFTGTEEEHTFNITYKEKGNIYTFNKNISIKLLRDTDKDGIADKDDDDKDGDGFSNAIEIARGSDPYNKDSLPDMSKKDELDNLIKQLEKLIEDTKNNPFDTKNKLDVDNLKNNYLPGKVTEKDNIKGSYSATTSDTDLLKLIEKTKKEIDDIKKEINKLRDKANFEDLDKEINKEVDNSYKELIDKIKEAKDLDRNISTQEEVDKITKEIKELREKIVTDKEELKKKIEELEKAISDKLCKSEACKTLLKEAKDLYNKDFILKEEMFNMIKRIDDLLDKEKRITNPNTGIKTYSLIIIFIIFISYKLIKKKKNYIR